MIDPNMKKWTSLAFKFWVGVCTEELWALDPTGELLYQDFRVANRWEALIFCPNPHWLDWKPHEPWQPEAPGPSFHLRFDRDAQYSSPMPEGFTLKMLP